MFTKINVVQINEECCAVGGFACVMILLSVEPEGDTLSPLFFNALQFYFGNIINTSTLKGIMHMSSSSSVELSQALYC